MEILPFAFFKKKKKAMHLQGLMVLFYIYENWRPKGIDQVSALQGIQADFIQLVPAHLGEENTQPGWHI